MHTILHEDLREFFDGFPRDAHPMPVLSAAVSALSTFYQDPWTPSTDQVEMATYPAAGQAADDRGVCVQASRWASRSVPGQLLNLRRELPADDVRLAGRALRDDPMYHRAMDVLLILHADHEQNCSTSTVRLVGSSHANLFASVAAGVNALFGPLHGGANQAVLEMLERSARPADTSTPSSKVKNKRTA
jgi:citrate synthase